MSKTPEHNTVTPAQVAHEATEGAAATAAEQETVAEHAAATEARFQAEHAENVADEASAKAGGPQKGA